MRDDDVGIRKKSKMVYEENTVKTVQTWNFVIEILFLNVLK